MKRVIIYAAVYGGIGVVVGVLMALYTQDVSLDQVVTAKQATPSPPLEVKKTDESL
jgi:hypothetical protein